MNTLSDQSGKGTYKRNPDKFSKKDTGKIVINFSNGTIRCRICGSIWHFEGKDFDKLNINKIDTFREKHKNCKK
jgi:hypothetical protein